MQKMQAVQRRLIKKTEVAMAKEAKLRDLERINYELRKQLVRRPGPDVGERLNRCRDTVKARGRQIKATLTFLINANNVYLRRIDFQHLAH